MENRKQFIIAAICLLIQLSQLNGVAQINCINWWSVTNETEYEDLMQIIKCKDSLKSLSFFKLKPDFVNDFDFSILNPNMMNDIDFKEIHGVNSLSGIHTLLNLQTIGVYYCNDFNYKALSCPSILNLIIYSTNIDSIGDWILQYKDLKTLSISSNPELCYVDKKINQLIIENLDIEYSNKFLNINSDLNSLFPHVKKLSISFDKKNACKVKLPNQVDSLSVFFFSRRHIKYFNRMWANNDLDIKTLSLDGNCRRYPIILNDSASIEILTIDESMKGLSMIRIPSLRFLYIKTKSSLDSSGQPRSKTKIDSSELQQFKNNNPHVQIKYKSTSYEMINNFNYF